MLSMGAADKRGKWLRNGACLLGATSVRSVPGPSPSLSAEAVLPGRHRYRHGRRGGDGAELLSPPEHWKLHFTAGRTGIPTPAPRAGCSERR